MVTVTAMGADKPPLPVTVIVQRPAATGVIGSVPVVVAGNVTIPVQPAALKPPELFACDIATLTASAGTAVNETDVGSTVTWPGELVGPEVGFDVGFEVGFDVGVAVGVDVGVPLGVEVGVAVGFDVGVPLGVGVGVPLGVDVGVPLGVDVGVPLGVDVGFAVGEPVGVGCELGTPIGLDTGSGPDGADAPPPPHAANTTATPVNARPNKIDERNVSLLHRKRAAHVNVCTASHDPMMS